MSLGEGWIADRQREQTDQKERERASVFVFCVEVQVEGNQWTSRNEENVSEIVNPWPHVGGPTWPRFEVRR